MDMVRMVERYTDVQLRVTLLSFQVPIRVSLTDTPAVSMLQPSWTLSQLMGLHGKPIARLVVREVTTISLSPALAAPLAVRTSSPAAVFHLQHSSRPQTLRVLLTSYGTHHQTTITCMIIRFRRETHTFRV